MTRRGLLLILSSPSGAGKSTLSRMLMAWDPTMRFSISATTRKPRPGEEDGREYYAISTEFDPDRAGRWVRKHVLPKLPSQSSGRDVCGQITAACRLSTHSCGRS